MGGSRDDGEWRRLRNQVVAHSENANLPCGICGHPIDYSAPGNTPFGPSVDHINPVGLGGQYLPTMEGLRVVHMRCNSVRGAMVTNAKRPRRRYREPPRIWA